MTASEAAKLVAVMLGAFPATKAGPETSAIYERMLSDLPYTLANAAVERLLATCRFMPTVAEIRDVAMTLQDGEQRTGGDAWGEVLALIGRYGIYRSPLYDFEISDPVMRRCVLALTWRELCNSENQAADRARFIDMYDRLAVQHRKSELSEGLPAMKRYRALQEKQAEAARLAEPERGSMPSLGRLVSDVIFGAVGRAADSEDPCE